MDNNSDVLADFEPFLSLYTLPHTSVGLIGSIFLFFSFEYFDTFDLCCLLCPFNKECVCVLGGWEGVGGEIVHARKCAVFSHQTAFGCAAVNNAMDFVLGTFQIVFTPIKT